MLREITIHGPLGDKYGHHHRFAINYPVDIVRAMNANFPGFLQDVRHSGYRLIRGPEDFGEEVTEFNYQMSFGKVKQIVLLPGVSGAGGGQKSKGVFQIIAAVALVAGGVIATIASGGLTAPLLGGALGAGFTGGSLIGAGVLMGLSGVFSLLSAVVQGKPQVPTANPSFIYNGAVNTATEGFPIPLVFGRFRVGSLVISGVVQNFGTSVNTDSYSASQLVANILGGSGVEA